ncbi:hypothetical protein O8E88_000247 [Flavobacterium psychrophilum]|jgi:hypothetical protein|uniref:Uncharacterized protein n=1 Tax=Flavobacterium psychrophilum TaxID=96345 RepID=A0A8G2G000_FLAPS|nr:hypothetical protein [Flavobacterium psychrophilum]AIN74308.1 membrane protein [Flavobacterium psychrophilum FPG3]EKT2068470.1 hypothetical protein [Flavobacterium psychrophilum]EKT2070575.1 hypothetical protein [Flavobacterium psychrophilum]EKT3957216.1 hypothetical protein [Flavobacterium psychrophilum]EKT3964576.1 hypothetical protein [Flavobacterium psychrophilum]
MKELDLLKKDWNRNDNYPKFSEQEIYVMLHKNSSSSVKWIFYISVIEFVFLNGIGYLLTDKKEEVFFALHPFLNVLQYINYFVIIVFIFLFYKNYKAISVLESSRKLIELILKTRKVVTYYIFWNIFIGGISGAYAALAGWKEGYNANRLATSKVITEINYIALLLVMICIMGSIWYFYKLIYGRFLSKLKNNYEELKKIDF